MSDGRRSAARRGSPRKNVRTKEREAVPSAPFSAQVPLPDVVKEISRRLREARRARAITGGIGAKISEAWNDGKVAELVDFRKWCAARQIAAARAENGALQRSSEGSSNE